MYYGFLGGIVASGTAATFIYIGERSFRVDPHRAVVASMAVIYVKLLFTTDYWYHIYRSINIAQKNKDLQSLLGSRLSAGKVYSYTTAGGGFGTRSSGSTSRWPIVWKCPEVQMLYVLEVSWCRRNNLTHYISIIFELSNWYMIRVHKPMLWFPSFIPSKVCSLK